MNTKYTQTDDLAAITEHVRDPLKQPWKWLFAGDSITHGAAHTNGWRAFPEIFAERVRWEMRCDLDLVVNTAFSGWTTEELLAHYESHIRFFQPQIVLIMIGMNDTLRFRERGGSPVFEQNLSTLTVRLREDRIIPVLQTCNPIIDNVQRQELLPEYMDIIRKVAKGKDVILVDHFAYWQKAVPDVYSLAQWLGEPIHPGSRGHLEMARLILKTLDLYDENSPCCHPAGL